MSGIAGILTFDGSVEPRDLARTLTSRMSHRGPDGIAHWCSGPVALGHCMNRTTPEALEEVQPLSDETGTLTLVFDGRLDNREKLRRELVARGLPPRDRSDPELVVRAYELWGGDSPRHLLGDFAFAVWDAPRGELFCARDHCGARPFHFVRNERFFAFASDDDALAELPGVSGRPNEELIAHFLVPSFTSFDRRRSWREDVRTLLSAESLRISLAGTVRSETYWRLQPGEAGAAMSDEEYEEAFREVFLEAVRCRMRALHPPAAMVSGGLDSAGIVASVRKAMAVTGGSALHTYSAIADDPDRSIESRCIAHLTKGHESAAHFVSVPSFRGMVSVDDLVDAALSKAHPIDNSILLPAMMCLAAGRNGHRVMLHGASGDLATFVPARYIGQFLSEGQWRSAWRECVGANANNPYLKGTSPLWLLLQNAWTGLMPGTLQSRVRTWRRAGSATAVSRSAINRDFARRIGLEDRLRAQEARDSGAGPASVAAMHLRSLASWPVEWGLSGYDRVAAPHGLELRDPWADRRVLQFLVGLPLRQRVSTGWTKFLARKAFSPDLNPEVCWRADKEHLGWLFTRRLMEASAASVAHILTPPLGALGEYVDTATVRARRLEEANIISLNGARQFSFEMATLKLWVEHVAA